MASRAGVSQPTISRWEVGISVPSPVMLDLWLSECGTLVKGNLGEQSFLSLVEELKSLVVAREPPSDTQARNIDRILTSMLGFGVSTYSNLVPCYADIAAGAGEQQEQLSEPRSMLSVPDTIYQRDPQCYAMRVIGDSMEPALCEGDTVIVSPQSPLVDGCFVAAYIDPHGDIVKRYRIKQPGSVVLESANPAYEPIRLAVNGTVNAHLWGRVVMMQREL